MAATQTPSSSLSTSPPEPAERSDVADMMPEPGQIGDSPAVAGDADDLIARMADAEIDKLMSAEDDAVFAPPTIGASDPAPTAAMGQPPKLDEVIPDPLAELERSQAAASAVEAALEAVVPPTPPAPISPPSTSSTPAPAAPPAPSSAATPIPEPTPPVDARSADADAVAAELAADAALHGRSAEPPPASSPPVAPVESTERPQVEFVERPVESAEKPSPTAATAEAEHAAPHPTIGELGAGATGHDVQQVPAADMRSVRPAVLARLAEWPWIVLDAMNYPVRHLSDQAREALGVVALVTLVNAIALTTYHVFFARH